MADGGQLAMPNCKKKKKKKKKNQTDIIQWHKVVQFHWDFFNFTFCYFKLWTSSWLVYFLINFETTQCKNHFDTNWIKIHSAVIEVVSFSCFWQFLVMADGGHLVMPNCKKLNWCHARIIVTRSWQNSTEIFSVSHFPIFRDQSHLHWSILY